MEQPTRFSESCGNNKVGQVSEVWGATRGDFFLSPFGDCAWCWQTPLVIWEHGPEVTLLQDWSAAWNHVQESVPTQQAWSPGAISHRLFIMTRSSHSPRSLTSLI